ncbi:FAD-binding oxidoreductase [Bacillus shivajii]|uniref:NAD(P)/FAD-dependent oxidoreductase n=1 Tax=Bacillus shivajii TaxID=1983719 RepID=UPI001CFA0F01|nr:FAD-binding oxidoreductase [Bacillus shivajii]UCZ52858.1 FAD-binding oxidoreductase [Bacillus shivajii]
MKYVVIGGGIVGACAAYFLSKKECDVTLIDKAFDGKATSAGAGIICPWISTVDDPDWYAIASRGALYYPELIASLKEDGEIETGYRFTGALATSEDLAELKELKEKVDEKKAVQSEVGDVQILEAPEAQKLFPPLDKHLHALYVSGSARLDGKLLANALVEGFKKNGGKFFEEKVTLSKQEDGKIAVDTSEGTVTADQVIVAGGAWTNDLLNPLGLNINVEAQRGQIAHLTVGEDTSNWPVVLPQDSSHYMVAFDDNRIAFGATREVGSGFDYRLTAGGVQEVLNEGLGVAPGLADATLKEVRVGFRPMSPDLKPLLGRVPQYSNLIIATGLGASGLTMGPYVGSLAAKLALNEQIELDLAPYDPMR